MREAYLPCHGPVTYGRMGRRPSNGAPIPGGKDTSPPRPAAGPLYVPIPQSSPREAVGIPMAYALAELLAGVMASVLFYFPVVLVAGAAVTTFTIGLAAVLISSAMPVRYAWGL